MRYVNILENKYVFMAETSRQKRFLSDAKEIVCIIHSIERLAFHFKNMILNVYFIWFSFWLYIGILLNKNQ